MRDLYELMMMMTMMMVMMTKTIIRQDIYHAIIKKILSIINLSFYFFIEFSRCVSLKFEFQCYLSLRSQRLNRTLTVPMVLRVSDVICTG